MRIYGQSLHCKYLKQNKKVKTNYVPCREIILSAIAAGLQLYGAPVLMFTQVECLARHYLAANCYEIISA
jgi:hypothetical protein